MKGPQSIEEAVAHMAIAFEEITGLRPKVTLFGRDDLGRVVVSVEYRGDELLRAVQIEAFVVGQGDTIRYRSQRKNGNTILVYNMQRRKQ